MEEDLVNDSTDYSEDDQEFITMIERKNLQRKRRKVNQTTEAVDLAVELSSSKSDALESDHGCEVQG